MIRAGGVLLAAALILPAAAHAQGQEREWWWDAALKSFTMPSESMEPTIPPGSYLIAAKRNPSEVRRGDLVAFRKDGSVWVKRVVALPGDRIGMVDGKVRLNGKLAEYGPGQAYSLPNPPFTGVRRSERLPGESAAYTILDLKLTVQDNVPEIVIPPNRFYMLGDNRDNSTDSRFSLAEGGIETVAFDDVYGVIDPAHVARGKRPSPPARAAGPPQIVPVEPE